ncbi:DNA mismatch repair protein msh6, partial [Nowakowskiella sp. JEL0407]
IAKLPDLERAISRIHTGTCRVKDFLLALSAFRQVAEMFDIAETHAGDFKSPTLRRICSTGLPEELMTALDYFKDAFDAKEALETDVMHPKPGSDEEYDVCNSAVEAVEQELEEFRMEQCKVLKLGKKEVAFKDVGKEIYQLEIPAKQKVPNDWTLMSKTQKVNRYYNSDLQEMVQRLLEKRELRDMALKNVKKHIYEKFDVNYTAWLRIVKNVADLDCFLSLANSKDAFGEICCRPSFVDAEGVFQVTEMRHPCIQQGISTDFIPNDMNLGKGADGNIILLTGPNMGGKSTLLRQTCITAILAQLGSYVPCSQCLMSPFDRIFTRIGANDNILAGQSTFMVELSETSKILKEATPRSLVILDELGRGTSTFDGYAIAYSVLQYLTTHVNCLGLFSTHYNMSADFENNKLVKRMYMNFIADDQNREVTFLYRLTPGDCPKSYGMNVASMAGVFKEIVDKADKISADFEESHKSKMNRKSGFRASTSRLSAFSDLIHNAMEIENGQSISYRSHGLPANLIETI